MFQDVKKTILLTVFHKNKTKDKRITIKFNLIKNNCKIKPKNKQKPIRDLLCCFVKFRFQLFLFLSFVCLFERRHGFIKDKNISSTAL